MPSDKIQIKNNKDKILSQRNFPESVQYQKPKWRYLWLGIVSAGLLVYAIFTFNFLFAVFIVLSDIISICAKKESVKIKIAIAEAGIEVGKNFYPYKDFQLFWLIYKPPETKNLYLEFKNKFKPRLIVPLENQNPIKIRKALSKYVTEDLKQEEELLGKQIEKWLKL